MPRTDAVQVILEVVARMRALDPRLRVTYELGWETRGNGLSARYVGGIVHDTTTPSSSSKPFPTQNMLKVGRVDLTGPLCNFAGPYCTVDAPWIHVVAAFPANHAGASGGRSMGPLPTSSLFNPAVLGLEIDFSGLAFMPAGQMYVGLLWARAVADVLAGGNLEYVRAHFETSITGKIDISYAAGKSYDMAAFRRDAAALTTAAAGGFLMALTDDEQTEVLDLLRRTIDELMGPDFRKPPGQAKTGWPVGKDGSVRRTVVAMLGDLWSRTPAATVVNNAAQPVQVDVNPAQVAAALAQNQTFLASLAKAVNDDAARRLAS